MDEHEIDEEACEAFLEHIKKPTDKKWLSNLKDYEKECLKQYLDPDTRNFIGDGYYEEE